MTLALERVELARGGRTLLRDISFVLDGGIVAIVGPNGVGKTTLLRAMAGALAPERGTIALDGAGVRELDTRERARRIALVDPSEPVLAALLVEDAVAAARFPHHRWWEWEATAEDDAAVDDALHRAGLTAFRHREIGTLSAGERQRVWIALAIAQRASVILFDEPTSHLDLKASVETLQHLRELADDGALVVVVLHQLEEAAAVADRVIVLGCGTVVADGPPEKALTTGLDRTRIRRRGRCRATARRSRLPPRHDATRSTVTPPRHRATTPPRSPRTVSRAVEAPSRLVRNTARGLPRTRHP